MSGIVIIGAGECGMRAAFAARVAGHGHEITVVGAEEEQPYERPPLSKPGNGEARLNLIASHEQLAKEGINLKTGVVATRIDRAFCDIALLDGSNLSYDKLLLATGASPRLLTCPGGKRARVLRTRKDAERIYARAVPRSNIVIVGAGLIGLELASVLVERDVSVTVLETAARPLGRNVPERLAHRLTERHLARGVNILCDASVALIDDHAVFLKNDRSLSADLVIAAIGVVPSTSLAAEAGLTVENGIVVDNALRTGDPNVLAAGDCACVALPTGPRQRFETWTNARIQGEIAGGNMAGASACFAGPVWFWSDQCDLGLQGVGDTSGSPAAIRTLGDAAEVLFFVDGSQKLVGAAGLGSGNTVARDIKLAQRLIEAEARPDLEALSNPSQNLKRLLRAA